MEMMFVFIHRLSRRFHIPCLTEQSEPLPPPSPLPNSKRNYISEFVATNQNTNCQLLVILNFIQSIQLCQTIYVPLSRILKAEFPI